MRGWPIRWARPAAADHPVPERGKPLRHSQRRMQNGRRRSACGPSAKIRTEMKICHAGPSAAGQIACRPRALDSGVHGRPQERGATAITADRFPRSTLLQHVLDLTQSPAFAERYDPDLYAAADQRVRGHVVVRRSDHQISLGLPCKREIQIAWKHLPLRAVLKLDDVAFGMGPDLHLRPQSAGGRAARTGAAAGPPRHRGTLDT